MLKNLSFVVRASAALGHWQKQIVTKHRTDNDSDPIPHPAAAPMSTDQEAGGSSSTPEGIILKDDEKPT